MDTHGELRNLVRNREWERIKQYEENSKDRLLEITRKKFLTTFIGALDKFEEAFSYLWENDEEMMGKWNLVRVKILDNGNNRLRELVAEIQNHTVRWNRYQTRMRVV